MEVNLLNEPFLFGRLMEDESICSGYGVRFYTDNEQVDISIRLARYRTVPQHIGSSLVNGVYYIISDMESQGLICHDVIVLKNMEQEITLFKNPRHKKILCEVYFPILNQVEVMRLITEEEIEPVRERKGKIAFLGGGLTYGVGTTSANFMFSNIISHQLKIDGYNLAEYNRNFLNPSKIRKAALSGCQFIVMELGCRGMDAKYLEENLYGCLDAAARNKGIHIFVFEEDSFFMTDEKRRRKGIAKSILKEFRKEYPVQILCLDDAFIEKDSDPYTYSGNFYNDYANIEIAKYCIPILKAWYRGVEI